MGMNEAKKIELKPLNRRRDVMAYLGLGERAFRNAKRLRGRDGHIILREVRLSLRGQPYYSKKDIEALQCFMMENAYE